MKPASNIAVKVQKPDRNSSIELLRILAACAVVVLHYNGMGKAWETSIGFTHQVLTVMESLCVCAVDLFIMISGYFLCTTQKRTWDKPIYLLLLLWIINIIAYILNSCVFSKEGISVITIAHLMIPPANYFVILYVTLYIVSPYINIVLNKLNDKGRTIMVVVLLLLFSVYPTLMDSYQLVMHHESMGINPVGAWGQQHGYTIVGFALSYIIGAWLRMNNMEGRVKNWKVVLLILVAALGIFIWFSIETHTVLRGTSRLIEYNALSYSNPLVLALTFLLVLLFSNLHFQSKLINNLAKATFVCYIFHLRVISHLKIENVVQLGAVHLFIHLFLSVLLIYLASWILWKFLDLILTPIVKWFRNKTIFNIYEK